MVWMGFTCILWANTSLVGRYWDFKPYYTAIWLLAITNTFQLGMQQWMGYCWENLRRSSGECGARLDCTYVQSGLALHSLQNRYFVANGRERVKGKNICYIVVGIVMVRAPVLPHTFVPHSAYRGWWKPSNPSTVSGRLICIRSIHISGIVMVRAPVLPHTFVPHSAYRGWWKPSSPSTVSGRLICIRSIHISPPPPPPLELFSELFWYTICYKRLLKAFL